MKKIAALGGPLLLAGVVLVAVPSGTAQAAESECWSNTVCLFGNNGFVWLIERRNGNSEKTYNLTGDRNDNMDSWMNRSGTHARGYFDANGRGSCISFWSNSKDDDVNYFNSDQVSSTRTNGAC